jgi:glucose repression regulatory protein TUP1
MKNAMLHKTLKADDSSQGGQVPDESGITSISISPSNTFVAGGCLDNFIRIWNINSGDMVAKLKGHEDSVYAVRFMQDGMRLVSGSLDYSVKYWDVAGLAAAVSVSSKKIVLCPLISSFKGHKVRCLTSFLISIY